MLKGFSHKAPSLSECNAPIVGISAADMVRHFCIYEVWKDEQLLFIGCCQLSMVFKMPDLKTNGHFIKTVGANDPLSIVIKFTGNRIDCYNKRGQMLRAVMPECNRHLIQARMVIMCNEDGRKFRTQAEVAEVYGIKPGNLSNHLAGKAGFNTVSGRTFVKVIDDEQSQL